ncbi:MAG TPA: hypothetical protein VL961_02260 [Acidimicrobiales bacterium]|nr:hypothetical protein [Acidimicrobiales bacterium]
MNTGPRARRCADVGEVVPELALGILTGRARSDALAHVEQCTRCTEELEQLSRAADAVVQVAPEVEPPLGFEVRLFGRMGVSGPATRRLHPRRVLAVLAAAAAVVALGVGLGVGLSGGPGPTTSAPAPHHPGPLVSVADLSEHGEHVGQVFTYGGPTPWVFMTLSDSAARGRVTCEVVTTGGAVRTVGTFVARSGYGAWGAPLPVAPQDVRVAEVVASDGSVVARARLG